MNLNRWHQIGEIYHSALPLLPTERNAYLSTACGENANLRQEVISLLEADDSSGEFLNASVFDVGLKLLMDDNSKSPDLYPALDPPTMDKLIGTTVGGRYWVEKELDRGGVGAVYLARDRKLLDRPVVVKVLLEKSLLHEWFALKFQQEKEALARVDHPGVVGILDTGELPDDRPYIVMQYVEGMSLREAIKGKPEGMDLERVASIIKQAGAALSSVHEKKIYHRDLKPENIMLQKLGRGDEQVKIVDFGIAKVKESVIAPSTVTGAATAGTIIYMSPEQLRGERVSAPSDIYSLGVIAYEMVTGRRPYNPDTTAHLAEMQREGVRAKPVDLRPRLPVEAQSIILKSLDFDPRARFQNAREFGNALAGALKNEEEPLAHSREQQVEILPTKFSSERATPETMPGEQPSETLVTPFVPARLNSSDHPVAVSFDPERHTRWWPKLAGGLVLVAALAIGAYFMFANREPSTSSGAKPGAAKPATERSFVYSLTVQKMRDNKPYQDPFESSGQEIFETGYKFQLNVSSPQTGYLYVFNEGVDERSNKTFTIIYPIPSINKGSAKLDANQPMRTRWNKFKGKPGTEEFWIVWSVAPVIQMEAAKDEAFKNWGVLTSVVTVRNVRDFLTEHSEPKPETKKDTAKQQTDVRGSGDLLVKLVELEHR